MLKSEHSSCSLTAEATKILNSTFRLKREKVENVNSIDNIQSKNIKRGLFLRFVKVLINFPV